MKRLVWNVFFILIAVFSGVRAFMVKYDVIAKEDQLKEIYRQILDDKREIHMLQAEWMYLNDPQRLKQLIAAQTVFAPVLRTQIVSVADLPDIPAPIPVSKPAFFTSDKEVSEHVAP